MDKFLTIKQISNSLKISKMTVYRYIKNGKLLAYKTGRDFRVKENDFNKFLEKYKIK